MDKPVGKGRLGACCNEQAILPETVRPQDPSPFSAHIYGTYAGPFLLAVLFLSIEAACDLFQPTIMSRVIDKGIALPRPRGSPAARRDHAPRDRPGRPGRRGPATSSRARSPRTSGRPCARTSTGKCSPCPSPRWAGSTTASIVTRLTNDVTQVQAFANGLMRIFVKAPLLAIGGIVMAILLDARMSLVLVAIVPPRLDPHRGEPPARVILSTAGYRSPWTA